jgi:hypothetical protein
LYENLNSAAVIVDTRISDENHKPGRICAIPALGFRVSLPGILRFATRFEQERFG